MPTGQWAWIMSKSGRITSQECFDKKTCAYKGKDPLGYMDGKEPRLAVCRAQDKKSKYDAVAFPLSSRLVSSLQAKSSRKFCFLFNRKWFYKTWETGAYFAGSDTKAAKSPTYPSLLTAKIKRNQRAQFFPVPF
jgi:hypothetical protein